MINRTGVWFICREETCWGGMLLFYVSLSVTVPDQRFMSVHQHSWGAFIDLSWLNVGVQMSGYDADVGTFPGGYGLFHHSDWWSKLLTHYSLSIPQQRYLYNYTCKPIVIIDDSVCLPKGGGGLFTEQHSDHWQLNYMCVCLWTVVMKLVEVLDVHSCF